MEFFPVGKTLDFMRIRWWFLSLSLLSVAASVVLFFVPGPVYGTDFKGGTEVEIAFKRSVEPGEIRAAVERAGFSGPEVVRVEDSSTLHRFIVRVREISTIDDAKRGQIQRALCFGEGTSLESCPPAARPSDLKLSPGGETITLRYETEPNLVLIRQQVTTVPGIALREGENSVSLQNAREHKVELQLEGKGDQILGALKAKLGSSVVPDTLLRSEWIGPKAGAQLRDSALKAVLVAFIFIMAYIAIRFDLRFAPGAVVAVAHDALVTMGVLVALRRELNLTIVAALLTVVGYSTNDKVVIYDRIRENLGKLRGMPFERLINVSLSETLSRTIITGGPTILSLLAFFFWGTGALKDFSLTLMTGIVVGTYSSMYVAVPFTWWLDRRFFSKKPPRKAPGRPAAAATSA